MEQLLPILNDTRAFCLMVVGFCFLILVHELGHFIAAKAVDMKVTQFALGMGPALFSWRKGLGFRRGSTEPEYEKRITEYLKAHGEDPDAESGADERTRNQRRNAAAAALGLGETEYRVNWIVLLGGYVKMLGQEDLKPDAVSSDDRAFNRKPPWARAIVLSAGVTMNLIFGILFFIIAFMAGVTMPPAVVGSVVPNGPAATPYAVGHDNQAGYQGIQTGDHIVRINGKPTTDDTDIMLEAALTNPGGVMDVDVERPPKNTPLEFRLKPAHLPGEPYLSLGIQGPNSLTVNNDPHSAKAPLDKVADKSTITAVAGKPVEHYYQMARIMQASRGGAVPFTFHQPDGKDVTVDLGGLPVLPLDKNDEPSLLGLVPASEVEYIGVNTPAAAAGLKPGDLLADVGGQPWPRMDQVRSVIEAHRDRTVNLTVWRDGKLVELTPATPNSEGHLGFGQAPALDAPFIACTTPDSPLSSLELNGGSRLVSVNGRAIDGYIGLVKILAKDDTGKLTVVYKKNLKGAAPATAVITLQADQRRALAAVVWSPPPLAYQLLRVPLAADDPITAARLGFRKTRQFMVQAYITLFRVGQGNIPASELRGIIGIAQVGTQIAKTGWAYLIYFLGLISVNLVVMNFLPIPILDGGQMLFLLIEKLKGSPVSIRAQSIATYIGLAIIGSLLLMTFYYDIGRLIHPG